MSYLPRKAQDISIEVKQYIDNELSPGETVKWIDKPEKIRNSFFRNIDSKK